MKPCRRNRTAITLLALGELDARRSRELRAHLENCEGCRQELEEISRVTGTLAAVEMESNLQTSEVFHRRVVEGMKVVRPASLAGFRWGQSWASWLNWRVLLPLSGAAAAIILLCFDMRQPEVRQSAPVKAQVVIPVAMAAEEADLLPSIGNYQTAAAHSMDSLNEMLDREADRVPAPTPIYTAAGSALSVMAAN